MRGSAAFRAAVAPGGVLAGPWVKNELWRRARAVPSLDLRFADDKSLRDAVSGQQLITFTRASSGTFVGSDGVLRTATTNLLTHSQQFDNATSWTVRNATTGSLPVVTANDAVAPDGTLTADRIVFSLSGAGRSDIFHTASTPASQATGSIWLRSATGTNQTVYLRSQSATVVLTVTTQWQRFSATGASSDPFQFGLRDVFTGGVTSADIHAWGAQLEQSSTVGEYIPTTSTINSAPRFDHNPTTGESLGLLVEEQRTNSIRNNTMVGAVAGTPGTIPTNWAGNAATDLTREVVGTGTENGISYIDLKYTGTVSASRTQFLFFEPSNSISASNGQSWAGSAWVKIVAGSLNNITSVGLQVDTRDSSLVYVSTPFTAAFTPTSTFTRYSGSGTATGATIAWIQPFLRFITASSGAIDITLRIGLPQLEQGAFATSVIPTTTTTVTRSADVASITGTAFSSWYRQDEGTVFADAKREFAIPSGPFSRVYQIQGASGASRIEQSYFSGGQVNFIATNSVIQAEWYPAYFIQNGVKSAQGLGANNVAGASNGVITGSDASVTLPTVQQMQIGAETASTNHLNGTIRRLTYWPQRLPNSTLQAITQ
jgi:hypothetical protein